mgnify:CR=1 FL=1
MVSARHNTIAGWGDHRERQPLIDIMKSEFRTSVEPTSTVSYAHLRAQILLYSYYLII